MNISITGILLGLGGKCLLDWALVFLQRSHISRGFLGVFAVSLAAADTVLALSVAAVHAQAGGYVSLPGLTLTRYHECLLVQIFGQLCSALQWPVALAAALDHFLTVTRLPPFGARPAARVLVTGLLWHLAAVHVFLLSDFIPVMQDVPHNQINQCWVSHSSPVLQVTAALLLALCCGALHAERGALYAKGPITEESRAHSGRDVARQAARIFLSTWAPFLLLLAVLALLPVGLPAHLALNAGWLCFLNSLLIAAILCAVRPASWTTQGPAAVPPDSFSEWTFQLVSTGENQT